MTLPGSQKAFLVEIISSRESRELRGQKTDELFELVKTHGNIDIVDYFYQHIRPTYKTYLGSGKLREIRSLMLSQGVSLLIVGNILKPAQIFNINEYLRVGDSGLDEEFSLQARDKIDLLLKIFDHHAKSTEAKLQVELAAIKHMGPRIFGMGMELSRQGGGIGTSGIGETNTEIMRRHLKKRRIHIQKELQKYEKVRKVHRDSRRRRGLRTVGLVGYTNAGKSTIMNALTKKGVLVEDKLFATLGTDVGNMYIHDSSGSGETVLVNDTIGFMRDLPPGLLDAFKSTLEDSIESDLLLHIVDSSDPLRANKIQVVNEILDSIGAKQERVLVFNKIDKWKEQQGMVNECCQEDNIGSLFISKNSHCDSFFDDKDVLFVSSITGEGLELLKQKIAEKLRIG